MDILEARLKMNSYGFLGYGRDDYECRTLNSLYAFLVLLDLIFR